jgi:hypothetical protein
LDVFRRVLLLLLLFSLPVLLSLALGLAEPLDGAEPALLLSVALPLGFVPLLVARGELASSLVVPRLLLLLLLLLAGAVVERLGSLVVAELRSLVPLLASFKPAGALMILLSSVTICPSLS